MNWNKQIRNRKVKIGVIGLGYVGFPVALAFAEEGFSVTGIDTDEDKVSQIEQGESPLADIESRRVRPLVEDSKLEATSDSERIADLDSLIICVPTPLRKSRDPDISFVVQATEQIAEYFEPPGLIILESTTYPGTTEEILTDRFSEEGWDLEEEILLAFSPERIDPGNSKYTLSNTPKVVGGYGERAGNVASSLYGEVVDEIVEVSNPRTAEMVKLLENVFRSVNIGLANEMALICERMDIDVWEVIDAAATKPFGFMPFYPGPGLGGHCIPVDPLFLSWKARLMDTSSRFIELADEINRYMPKHVVEIVSEALNDNKKCINGARICLLGVAYKPNVNDTRESPAKEIVQELRERHAELSFYDPFVDQFDDGNQSLPKISKQDLTDGDYDLALVVTNHDTFDYEDLLQNVPLVVDTRNALSDIEEGINAGVYSL